MALKGGHGWVTPRADGNVMRCGGPSMCQVCRNELSALKARMTSTFQPDPRQIELPFPEFEEHEYQRAETG